MIHRRTWTLATVGLTLAIGLRPAERMPAQPARPRPAGGCVRLVVRL